MTDKFWTKKRLDAAVEMRNAGKSYAEIGAVLGCSYKSVSSKMDRLRNHEPRQPRKDAWTPEMKAALIEHRQAGLSWRAVAKLLGRKEGAVITYAKKIKLKALPMPETFWTPERVATLRIGAENETPTSDIAALLGCTRNAVLGKINRLGLNVQKPRRKVEKIPIVASFDSVSIFIAPVLFSVTEAEVDEMLTYSVTTPKLTEPPPTGGVPIWDLRDRHCRYILNDTMDTESLRYCGGQIVKGGPWCATHHKICCTPFPARKGVERRYR